MYAQLPKPFTISRKFRKLSSFFYKFIDLLLLPVPAQADETAGRDLEGGWGSFSTTFGNMTHPTLQAPMKVERALRETCKLLLSLSSLSTGRVRGTQRTCSSLQRANSWPFVCQAKLPPLAPKARQVNEVGVRFHYFSVL